MLSLLALLAQNPAVAATPYFGLEYRPFDRGDLAWVTDQRTSGSAVGEFDGVSNPNLQAWFGAWLTPRFALGGTLGVARMQNTTWSGDNFRQRHWGVVRPAVDLRFALAERQAGRPLPWLLFGGHGDIPSSRDVSNGYTNKEQKAADDSAANDRARLGGVGARTGFGVELDLTEALTVGGMYTLYWHRSVLEGDDASAVSSWLSGEAALLLMFRWPKSEEESP